MIKKTILIFFHALLCATLAEAQSYYPKNYFISPVDTPIYLSGGFGDIRQNHLHSGIDIRTGGVEGKKVYAIADGYLTRIKISPYGFGKAIYIDHPNGFTSVYAHLKDFNPTIAAYVKSVQYDNESFEIDAFIDKGKILVKKGELIAYSGNSGGSEGPHLHFEMRGTLNEHPTNPLLFGFPLADTVPPVIKSIKIYPITKSSRVNGRNRPVEFFIKKDSILNIRTKDTIRISGKISFGIQAYDLMNKNNSNGVYSIKLYVDSTLCFSQRMESFSYDETRYVNSLIDYDEFFDSRKRIQKTYVAPGNKLSIYQYVKNKGQIEFFDQKRHNVNYVVQDVFGNTSSLAFCVVDTSYAVPLASSKDSVLAWVKIFPFNMPNKYVVENLSIDIPKGSLYDTLYFQYKRLNSKKGFYSDIHCVHNKNTPLQKGFVISIKPDSLPSYLINKALIVSVDNNKVRAEGGLWKDGYVVAQVSNFGNFTIAIDTIPPVVKPLNIHANQKIKNQSLINVLISDNLSGIKSYRATLNDRWILMEYDAKNSLLTCAFSDFVQEGKNVLKVQVADRKGNVGKCKLIFYK